MLPFVSFIGISIGLLLFGYFMFTSINIIRNYFFIVKKTGYTPPVSFAMLFVIMYALLAWISLEIVLFIGTMQIAGSLYE